MPGGSAGDPKVTKEPKTVCAFAGGTAAALNASSKITPIRLMDFLLTFSPAIIAALRPQRYRKTQTASCKQNQ